MPAPSRPPIELDANPTEPLLDQVADWLSLRCHENLGAEILLRARRTRPLAHCAVARRGSALVGVSVLSASGGWYLEAADPETAVALVDEMRVDRPERFATVAAVRDWVHDAIDRRWTITRHHRLLAMTASFAKGGKGRWATPADVDRLIEYQALYNAERRTTTAPRWEDVIKRRQIAVLEDEGRIAAVVKRSGETARYACIGDTFTFPKFRRRGLGRELTAFMIAQLLVECPRVHCIVDDDNHAALALYRGLEFGEIGECFFDHLAPRA
jgi:GNAT superfamily N-acetyltransferase